METAFVIFLAGCSHDLSLCEPIETYHLTASDRSVCEEILAERVMETTAPWPVYHGSCEPVLVGTAAVPPEWWPRNEAVVALADLAG